MLDQALVQPGGVDPGTAYTNSERHDTSQPAVHNRVSEINRFVSIVQYEHTSALLPVQLVALSYFDSKTICLITPLQYVLHRRLTEKQWSLIFHFYSLMPLLPYQHNKIRKQ